MPEVFQAKLLPDSTKLVGYTWLISHFNFNLPVRELSCVSSKRLSVAKERKESWSVFDSQMAPDEDISSQLEFALKHERLDLLLIKKVLTAWGEQEVEKYVQDNSRGIYNRKVWFYYEFFSRKNLTLKDLGPANYVNLIDDKIYFTNPNAINSKRHKIKNNLLGNASFCPVICKTPKLKLYIEKNLKQSAHVFVGQISPSVLRRAASFLLLSDSKASFEIEGERPPQNRIERWGKIINEAGKTDFSIKELKRLHGALIQNSKFIKIGLRDEGVFLGERDRDNNPIPEFIGAREDDLSELMEGLIQLNNFLSKQNLSLIHI